MLFHACAGDFWACEHVLSRTCFSAGDLSFVHFCVCVCINVSVFTCASGSDLGRTCWLVSAGIKSLEMIQLLEIKILWSIRNCMCVCKNDSVQQRSSIPECSGMTAVCVYYLHCVHVYLQMLCSWKESSPDKKRFISLQLEMHFYDGRYVLFYTQMYALGPQTPSELMFMAFIHKHLPTPLPCLCFT